MGRQNDVPFVCSAWQSLDLATSFLQLMKLKRSGWVNLQSLAHVERFLVFDNIVIIGQACHIPLISTSLVTTSTWTLPLRPIQVLRSDGATKELKVLIDFCVGK